MEENFTGKCVSCNRCQPCLAKIDIAKVNEYVEAVLSEGSDSEKIREAYMTLEHRASLCMKCGLCEMNCPNRVRIRQNMKKAVELFGE